MIQTPFLFLNRSKNSFQLLFKNKIEERSKKSDKVFDFYTPLSEQ